MANSTDIERAAAAWLARREAGWSEAEQARFAAWRDASIAHRVAWLRIETGWQRAARLKALAAGRPAGTVPPPGAWPEPSAAAGAQPAPPAPADLRGLALRGREHVRPHSRGVAMLAAAVVLLAIGLAGVWRFAAVERAVYATAIGQTREVVLGDGSVAWLSSDSRIEVAYSRWTRRLDLQRGEAYFQVAHQPGRPFRVGADARAAVAVGTRFSVRREREALVVLVTEGLVRLEGVPAAAAAPALLEAGTLAIAGSDGVRVQRLSRAQIDDRLSWREGVVVFRATPLAEAVAEFNRYNVHRLVVADPAIAAIPVGGRFRWSNADAFVRVLEQSFGLRAERDGDETRLRAR
jgi:transmembrane sensor